MINEHKYPGYPAEAVILYMRGISIAEMPLHAVRELEDFILAHLPEINDGD